MLSLFFGCRGEHPKTAVGYLENDKAVIIDSVSVKNKVLHDLSKDNKNLKLNKVEIENIITIGEEAQNVYFLLITSSKNARIGKYLFLIDNYLYFYDDLIDKARYSANEVFYNSYYVCYGSDDPECTPHIGYIEGEMVWGAGKAMVCLPESSCKTMQIFSIEE